MAQQCSISVAVVLYNRRCEDSPTCMALAKLTDRPLTVLIHDNSTSDFGIREFCDARGWIYLGGNGNAGISKAYNACVDYLKTHHRTELLCLFDDDTQLEARYFSRLEKARRETGCRILLPLIFAKDRLLSPCLLTEGHRVTRFPDAEAALNYRGDRISAINSGMALALSLFDNYRYDENIFLDGVDHHFMMDMRRKGEKAAVFSYRCDHDFSGASLPEKGSALNRFRIYTKDYSYILKDRKTAYCRLVGKRALKLALQYRSGEFMKVFFNSLSR